MGIIRVTIWLIWVINILTDPPCKVLSVGFKFRVGQGLAFRVQGFRVCGARIVFVWMGSGQGFRA